MSQHESLLSTTDKDTKNILFSPTLVSLFDMKGLALAWPQSTEMLMVPASPWRGPTGKPHQQQTRHPCCRACYDVMLIGYVSPLPDYSGFLSAPKSSLMPPMEPSRLVASYGR